MVKLMLIIIEFERLMPVKFPPQPVKVQPAAGTALSCTSVQEVYCPFDGLEPEPGRIVWLTVPLPVMLTVNV